MPRIDEAEVEMYAPYRAGNKVVLTGEVYDDIVEFWDENGKYYEIPIEQFKKKYPKRGTAKDLDRFDEGIVESVTTVYEDRASTGTDVNQYVDSALSSDIGRHMKAALDKAVRVAKRWKSGSGDFGSVGWRIDSVTNVRYGKARDTASWDCVANVTVKGRKFKVPVQTTLYAVGDEFAVMVSAGGGRSIKEHTSTTRYGGSLGSSPAMFVEKIVFQAIDKHLPNVFAEYMAFGSSTGGVFESRLNETGVPDKYGWYMSNYGRKSILANKYSGLNVEIDILSELSDGEFQFKLTFLIDKYLELASETYTFSTDRVRAYNGSTEGNITDYVEPEIRSAAKAVNNRIMQGLDFLPKLNLLMPDVSKKWLNSLKSDCQKALNGLKRKFS